MPQFEIATFASQLFWLFVNISLLYLMLAYVILPRIARALNERKHVVQSDLLSAKEMLAEAEATKQKYEYNLAKLRAESSDKMQNAVKTIESNIYEKERLLTQQLAERIRVEDARLYSLREGLRRENLRMAKKVTTQLMERLLAQYFPKGTFATDKLEDEVEKVLEDLFDSNDAIM